ncbi:hypothetical protein IPM62_02215 [Candidatus Woesebacteria bacterium]|nr:MAG: hypothetical protein IPM62_02215 [Candidatus Woesebacteria bacterium]
MTSIIFGTTNEAKIKQLQSVLSVDRIEVVGIEDKSKIPEIVENGETALDNARIKSFAYAKALGKTVFSMDNALYLSGLTQEKQPGVNVRRIHGMSQRPTDEQMRDYYSKLIDKLGGKVNGYWEYGVCIANEKGEYKETVIRSPRVFVGKPSAILVDGYPLESLQIDPETGRYISEMTREEQDIFWRQTIGQQLLMFFRSVKFA